LAENRAVSEERATSDQDPGRSRLDSGERQGRCGTRRQLCHPVLANLTITALLGLAAFVLYLSTLAPGVLGGDSGELQFAAALGGIAHPSGYPLYLMLGWLWSQLLPWGDAAWRLNLFSALWGGAAVALAYLLIARLLRSAIPHLHKAPTVLVAATAALALACSDLFWSQAVAAEIYTLHAAFVALVLLLLLEWEARLGRPESAAGAVSVGGHSLATVAIAYGLSLTHHLSMLMLAPALLVTVWLTLRASRRGPNGPRFQGSWGWILALGCFLLPLLLYLYIPLRAPHTAYMTVELSATRSLQLYDRTLQGFLTFVSGRVYAGALLSPAEAWARLPMAAGHLLRQFGRPGLVLGLLGVARLAGGRRWRLLALTALSFLALVVFNLFYGIGDIHVFFIAPTVILACWMGLGMATLVEAGTSLLTDGRGLGIGRRRSLLGTLLAALFVVLPLMLLLHNLPLVDRSDDTGERERWHQILANQPPSGAILVTNDRDEMTSFWYLQQIESVRPDLTGVFPLIVQEPGWANVGQLAERALETGRRVFLVKPMAGLEVKFSLRPAGDLVEVLGLATGGDPSQLAEMDLAGSARLIGYDLRSSLEPGGELEVALHWQPLAEMDRDYTSFVHLLGADGQRMSQSDHLVGGIYYPTSLWQPTDRLLDLHRLPLPSTLGPAPHRLLIGFYEQPSLDRPGEPLQIILP